MFWAEETASTKALGQNDAVNTLVKNHWSQTLKSLESLFR